MSLRVGGWLGVSILVIGWWLASFDGRPAAHDRVQLPVDVPHPQPRDRSAFTERLRSGLRSAPGTPHPRRNPFMFERDAPRVDTHAPIPTPYVPPAPVEPSPAMTLAGIGTSETADGVVRTAVVSAAGQVWLVKAGDELPSGLRVLRVEEDHVVLADAAGAEITLHLR